MIDLEIVGDEILVFFEGGSLEPDEQMFSDEGDASVWVTWYDGLPAVDSVRFTSRENDALIKTWIEEAVQKSIRPEFADDYWVGSEDG